MTKEPQFFIISLGSLLTAALFGVAFGAIIIILLGRYLPSLGEINSIIGGLAAFMGIRTTLLFLRQKAPEKKDI